MKELNEINKESLTSISKICDSYLHEKFNPISIEFYSLNIIRHLVFIQKGIQALLIEFEEKPELELPIGILLRSACLDILQFGYIKKSFDDIEISTNPRPDNIPDDSKFKKDLKKIFAGNLKNQILDEKTLSERGAMKENEYKENEENYKNIFSFLLNEKNDFEESLPARKIYKKLKENPKYENFSNVFYDYSYYSKLEHFGVLTWALTIKKANNSSKYHRLINVLKSIFHVYEIALIYLEAEKDTTNETINSNIDNWIKRLDFAHTLIDNNDR